MDKFGFGIPIVWLIYSHISPNYIEPLSYTSYFKTAFLKHSSYS